MNDPSTPEGVWRQSELARIEVLNLSDEASVHDTTGHTHHLFQENRRLLMLAVPKSLYDGDQEGPRGDLEARICEVVEEAMLAEIRRVEPRLSGSRSGYAGTD